jgi:hypothetical protein
MRYVEIADPRQPSDSTAMRRLMDGVRAAHAARIRPEIDNPTVAQRAAMQHVVECPGLTVHDLGGAFADEFWDRRLWCRRNCEHEFTVEPVWDRTEGRDTGRRFLFADHVEAVMFRLTWG